LLAMINHSPANGWRNVPNLAYEIFFTLHPALPLWFSGL
jgi:hypothetical protein